MAIFKKNKPTEQEGKVEVIETSQKTAGAMKEEFKGYTPDSIDGSAWQALIANQLHNIIVEIHQLNINMQELVKKANE